MESSPASQVLSTQEIRNWCLGAHLSAFAGALIPGANIAAPLVLWLVKKDESKEIAEHALEALNFQITVTIAMLVSMLLAVVVVGFVLMAGIGIAASVLTIVAAVKASKGESYRYPLTLRLVGG